MKELYLYNQLTNKKERFVPLESDHVRLYVCGPTVYDWAHIGNGRPVVVFDVLVRLLRYLYGKVTYVRNVTDVDDKIIKAAQDNDEQIESLTVRMLAAFHEDMEALGASPPDIEPCATHHITDMIAMIEGLLAKGCAYECEGHVLFSSSSWQAYGTLSGREMTAQQAGARIEIESYKKEPYDFVLWKPDDTFGWESPWGKGRPGWHIECSAMSHHYLGTPFDIHGGGQDLIFPHHENEIAQSCSFCGTSHMARFWIHNGYVTYEGEKMSKSLGNILTVRQLRQEWQGEVLRYWLLGTHYKKPLDLSHQALCDAEHCLDRLYRAKEEMGEIKETRSQEPSSYEIAPAILEALCDDMNTPLALHLLLAGMLRGERIFYESARFLGFLGDAPSLWFKGGADESIDALIAEREMARKNKDYTRADDIRASLDARGIILEDKAQETSWRRKRHYE